MNWRLFNTAGKKVNRTKWKNVNKSSKNPQTSINPKGTLQGIHAGNNDGCFKAKSHTVLSKSQIPTTKTSLLRNIVEMYENLTVCFIMIDISLFNED